jgi:23S rRNA (guanosine2251-2'-O)-methyltransferase
MSHEKLYGIHPVLEALEGQRRRIHKVLLDARRHDPEVQCIATLATQRGIPVETMHSADLRRLLGHSHHQGVVALVAPLLPESFADVLSRLEAASGWQTVVVLDEVTDVGNFAALIRSAVAFGVEALCLPRHRSVSLNPTVAKRSAGALERLSVVEVANVVHALKELKGAGFWVYGADAAAATAVGQVVWPERVVLVVGSEERGLRRLVRECCDALVRIPMRAGVDSLNVAVAGAIILASIWGQRTEILPQRC